MLTKALDSKSYFIIFSKLSKKIKIQFDKY